MIRKLGATNLILIANVLKIDNKLSVDKTDHEVSNFKFQAYVAIHVQSVALSKCP